MRSITFDFSIACRYFFLGLCWIFFTDLLLTSMAFPTAKALFLHTAKGGVFILATSFLLYYLVKRHSIKLQEREAYLSSILDSQSYFLIRVDLQGNYTFVNSAFCQKYGYQEKEIINQSYKQYLLTEDHEMVKAMLQRCSSYPGKIVSLETHRYDRQGKRFTTSWEFVAVRDAAGKVVELQGVGQDVTEQQATYKQLTETKERLEHILSTMQEVVWSARAEDLSIHYINAACQEVTGYSQQAFYEDKQLWMKIIHPEDQQRVKEVVRQFLMSSGKDEVEYRIIHKDGSVRYLHKKAILIKDEENNIGWINGVCSDVTASTMIEQQTRENSRIRKNLLESMTDAFLAVDKQWNFTYVNKECERMLNVSREEVIGKNVWKVFPDAVKSKFLTEYQRAMKEQISIKVEDYLPSVKSWFRAAAYPTAEGLAVYFQDITREKELSLEVEKSEKYHSALINSIHDLIWIVSPDFEIVTANTAYRRIVEMITKQRVKTTDKAFNFSIKESADEKWNDYYQRALQGESFRVEEAFFTRRGPKFLEISFNPILSAGTVIGAGCIARDITESKKNMTKVRRQNEKLKEIAHLQSHTLRRPVATILGLINLFDKENISSSFNAEIIDKVEKVGKELDAVIHQIVAKTVELE